MTKLNLIVNRSLDGKFAKLKLMAEGYRDEYLKLMAQNLILVSPVDTNTYITNHNIGTIQVAATASSDGKLTKQPYEPFAQEGFNNLLSDIASLPEGVNNVVMSNASMHSDEVEYTHGYLPYAQTANEHGRIAAQAAANVKAGS